MPLTWQPILTGPEADRAAAAIGAVARDLAAWPAFAENDPFGASLATGEAGLALFFSYLHRARPAAGYGELADERLDRAVDRLATSFHQPGLYQGFTGIAWTVEHLRNRQEEDPNEAIDRALFDLLAKSPWRDYYDLTSGLAGLGAYALERWPATLATSCLARVCERLEELAVPQEIGIAWPTAEWHLQPRERQGFPHGMINLGVAHGVPGVLPVLAQAAVVGAAAESARSLLRGAVAWLLAQKLPANSQSVFPTAWGPGAKPAPARTAWCYGDLGIAAALLVAARATGEPAWEAEALGLARSAARRDPEACGVRDACLCHGAAGVGHLFNRLHQETGDPELLTAARTWFERALDMREPNRGVGGVVAWGPDVTGKVKWWDDPSLLTGATGVALALLAATTPLEPTWDRFLLLSRTCTDATGTTYP
jgi:lantibiotic modifying enzyme